jgi:hypothetical protein
MLNLGDAWIPGQPAKLLYQERVLLRLVDELGTACCSGCTGTTPPSCRRPRSGPPCDASRAGEDEIYGLGPRLQHGVERLLLSRPRYAWVE